MQTCWIEGETSDDVKKLKDRVRNENSHDIRKEEDALFIIVTYKINNKDKEVIAEELVI